MSSSFSFNASAREIFSLTIFADDDLDGAFTVAHLEARSLTSKGFIAKIRSVGELCENVTGFVHAQHTYMTHVYNSR